MLDSLDQDVTSSEARHAVCQAFDQAVSSLRGEPGDRSLVARIEESLASDPASCFETDSQGWVRLRAGARTFEAGRFACRSLDSLRAQIAPGRASLRLFVLLGQSPLTDIGSLQALAPVDSLFQAASQFNCLESPGPWVVPVSRYFSDPTQGPRASISAYPATLLRHYRAPGPQGPFVQRSEGPQLNLLHRVALPGVAQVESGYLLSHRVEQPQTFATLLHEHFGEIEVGLHEGAEVVLGGGWDGPVVGKRRIAQVFTSTLAAGGYSRVDFREPVWLDIVTQLQRAAYLGTLLSAAATGQRRAVLTLIGGGVFGNPLPLIWDCILWACQEVSVCLSQDLTVIVNGRILEGLDLNDIGRQCRQMGGDVVFCLPSGTRFQ